MRDLATQSETGSSPGTAPVWWTPALSLNERLAGATGAATVAGATPTARLAGWRARFDTCGAGLFDRWLADSGLDEQLLLRLLAESPASLASRLPRPWWAEAVERAVRADDSANPATVDPSHDPDPTDWRDAFTRPLRPLIADTVDWLIERSRSLIPAAQVDLTSVIAGFTVDLGRDLARLAARTLVVELRARRDAGRLPGADSRERFAAFIRQMSQPAELADLLHRYPVLARLLAQAGRFRAEALLELLTRYSADHATIAKTIFSGADPGPVRHVGEVGDPHRQGRAVQLLDFAGGNRVVYKPRTVEPQLRLNELVQWMNNSVAGLDLRTPAVVAGAGYGWVEYIANDELKDPAQAARFHHRLGALLALLHAVGATDMHYENVIACGEQPVVVDPETIFHPFLTPVTRITDPAARALATSVARVALLPSIEVGEEGVTDISGLGHDPAASSPHSRVDWADPCTDQMRLVRRPVDATGSHNRARLGGVAVDPVAYRDVLCRGFRQGYDVITRDRTTFGELLRRSMDLEVRAVLRPTRGYTTLLEESTHPGLLTDGMYRDEAFSVLWTQQPTSPLHWRAAAHEARDLWQGDVPLFTSRPGSTNLWASDGRPLPDVLDEPSGVTLDAALRARGEVDRQDQEWIIRATLATRSRDNGGHRVVDVRSAPLAAIATPPERLLTAACSVADRIVAMGLTDGGRVNWLGLELVDDRQLLVMPMGAGLANGYIGVALFLGELAAITGIPRYADVARRAADGYRTLHRTLLDAPQLIPAIGCGALHGLGGICYGLSRLAVLLADDALATLAAQTVGLVEGALAEPTGPDWSTGVAGCLAAMTAVHRELDLAPARRIADACADLLVASLATDDDPSVPTGFAEGIAGVAFALSLPSGSHPGRQRARDLVWRTGAVPLAMAESRNDPGWYRGLAGRLMAGYATAESAEQWRVLRGIARRIAEQPVHTDLSLCHGEAGITEALIALAEQTGHDDDAAVVRHRAGQVLQEFYRSGPSCGTPGHVPTPGLLTGLAGIGYGLLRLGFAATVPSVLTLAPAPQRQAP